MSMIESTFGGNPYTYDPNKLQQGGVFIGSVRDNPFDARPFERGSRQPDFPAIHPYDQQKKEDEMWKRQSVLWDWKVKADKNEKKELRFTISAFPTPNNKRDNIVFIYLWNGKDWVWDDHKDDIIGALERYPLKQWKWSSLDE